MIDKWTCNIAIYLTFLDASVKLCGSVWGHNDANIWIKVIAKIKHTLQENISQFRCYPSDPY